MVFVGDFVLILVLVMVSLFVLLFSVALSGKGDTFMVNTDPPTGTWGPMQPLAARSPLLPVAGLPCFSSLGTRKQRQASPLPTGLPPQPTAFQPPP